MEMPSFSSGCSSLKMASISTTVPARSANNKPGVRSRGRISRTVADEVHGVRVDEAGGQHVERKLLAIHDNRVARI